MAGELVLITGVTGHLGFRALRYALEHGYRVRAAVRSETKAKSVLSNSALVELKANPELSFAVVPDITAPDAYCEAIKDVSYVIHIASPLAMSIEGDDYEAGFIQPAVQGTLRILEAAKKSGTVKRVVITSSSISITPWDVLLAGHYDGVIIAEDRVPTPSGPYSMGLHAYWASKVTALNRAEAWMKEHSPSFDLIHIHPSYIEGRKDAATTVEDLR
ncbi:Ketoreductase CTB6 [Fulvia fulva]|uniref:Ketoreductase CTB6 n=1 Tax=Passalora fulva TaxID=5499 RepID=A0A9Q8UUG9_PASFU|nr:Ketoreductase CTB6 [Fulvia fulva]KAK4628120.1 Ketoreductase CTB6 [Fulvia fulva]UJO22898.1 Ketoreductase CTB6 [Fulvia fulva]WPV28942.1 Ketoreductase CTB6 [Fulvia fulva]